MSRNAYSEETQIETHIDYESSVMPDLEYFYKLVMEIKKANRKYLSNYYLKESVWSEAISQGDVSYQYKKNEYLNLWWRKEHFKRLYYFVADPYHYKVNDDSMPSVCDVICNDSGLENVCRMLSCAGMIRYAVYKKWVGKNVILSNTHNRESIQIIDEDDGRIFIDNLYLYFDEFSDLLPDENEIDKFIKEKHFIGAHNTCNNMLIAGIVYTKYGSAITEDFLFVADGYRGLDISKLLHDALYQKYSSEKFRYTAWIRENNVESANLHHAYHYEQLNQFKVTFLKQIRE